MKLSTIDALLPLSAVQITLTITQPNKTSPFIGVQLSSMLKALTDDGRACDSARLYFYVSALAAPQLGSDSISFTLIAPPAGKELLTVIVKRLTKMPDSLPERFRKSPHQLGYGLVFHSAIDAFSCLPFNTAFNTLTDSALTQQAEQLISNSANAPITLTSLSPLAIDKAQKLTGDIVTQDIGYNANRLWNAAIDSLDALARELSDADTRIELLNQQVPSPFTEVKVLASYWLEKHGKSNRRDQLLIENKKYNYSGWLYKLEVSMPALTTLQAKIIILASLLGIGIKKGKGNGRFSMGGNVCNLLPSKNVFSQLTAHKDTRSSLSEKPETVATINKLTRHIVRRHFPLTESISYSNTALKEVGQNNGWRIQASIQTKRQFTTKNLTYFSLLIGEQPWSNEVKKAFRSKDSRHHLIVGLCQLIVDSTHNKFSNLIVHNLSHQVIALASEEQLAYTIAHHIHHTTQQMGLTCDITIQKITTNDYRPSK